MKKTIFAAIAVSILAGCGGSGVSVSTEVGAGDSVEAGSTLDRLKSIFFKKEAKATIQYPAAGLILESLGEGYIPAFIQNVRALPWPAVPKTYQDFGFVSKVFQVAAERDGVAADYKAAAKTEEERQRIDALNFWRIPIWISVTPCNGWEVDPYSAEEAGYLRLFEASTVFTNQVLTDLASRLSVNTLADPVTAAAAARDLWYSQDPAALQAAWTRAVEASTNRGGVNIDLTGSGTVGWRSAQGRFDCDAVGVVWKKAGQTWYGDGKLTGREYAVGLVSATGGEMRRSESTSDNVSTGSRTDSSGRAGVGK